MKWKKMFKLQSSQHKQKLVHVRQCSRYRECTVYLVAETTNIYTLTLVYDIIITRDTQRLSSKSHVIVFYYYYYTFFLFFIYNLCEYACLLACLVGWLIALLALLFFSLHVWLRWRCAHFSYHTKIYCSENTNIEGIKKFISSHLPQQTPTNRMYFTAFFILSLFL